MEVFKPKRTDPATRKTVESRHYYYDFFEDGQRYQGSTKLGDYRKAQRFAEELRIKIRLGDVDPATGRPFKTIEVPTLRAFSEDFLKSVRTKNADKPSTVDFYEKKMKYLLQFSPLADAQLDQIDAQLLDSFREHRSKAVSLASVNRELTTLRKALYLALEWNKISRVPKFNINTQDENKRDFVLSDAKERDYLARAPQPLRDAATVLLDTGLRVGELLALVWPDVDFVSGTRGIIRIREGKTKNAKRTVGLTTRARTILEARYATRKSEWVFTNEAGDGPLSIFTLEGQHREVRDALGLGALVLHSFRHTAATRLGEAGAEAVELMHAFGWGSLDIAARYDPSTQAMTQAASDRLESRVQKALPSRSNKRRKRSGASKTPCKVPVPVTRRFQAHAG